MPPVIKRGREREEKERERDRERGRGRDETKSHRLVSLAYPEESSYYRSSELQSNVGRYIASSTYKYSAVSCIYSDCLLHGKSCGVQKKA